MVSLKSSALFDNWRKVTDERKLPVTGLILAFALALLPLTTPSNYLLHISVLAFVYVTLGLGLNIVVGLAGLLDLGYVAFYAVGAYTYALLSLQYRVPFLIALIIGAGFSALVGIILGWPTIRTRGDYLALVTLGFGEMIRLLLRNWNSLTNGPRGLMNVPTPSLGSVVLSTPLHFYYLGLLLAMFALALSWRLKVSGVGRQLTAIKDDEDAAAAIGINPVRWKLYAFALGAFMAGLAGVFFASWQQFVSPESFTLGESILILSIVVLGGMGRVWPTVAAACFLVLLPEALRGLETYRILGLGLLLILIVVIQERLRLAALGKQRRAPQANLPTLTTDALTSPDDWQASKKDSPRGLVLSISEVSKHFGGVRALEDVSLNFDRGEIVGLVGANGAGKTTLFSCISGALRADGGRISLHLGGKPEAITGLSTFQIARKGVVRTFQQPRLFRSLTASGNVGLGKRCHDVPPFWEPFLWTSRGASNDDSASGLPKRLGGPSPETSVEGMSFVDQKMTELARALATAPEVLLLDEPASGMEPSSRERLAQALRWANESLGITLIIVEHDLRFLESLCKRIVVMNRGRVVADGPPLDTTVTKAISLTYEAPT